MSSAVASMVSPLCFTIMMTVLIKYSKHRKKKFKMYDFDNNRSRIELNPVFKDSEVGPRRKSHLAKSLIICFQLNKG